MKKKQKKQDSSSPVELNVVPFIDIFSLLCTFLLFSAVFVSIGIIDVQVPYLSYASSKKNEHQDKAKRFVSLSLEISKNQIDLSSKWSVPPIDSMKDTFPNTKNGLESLRLKLADYKSKDKETDKITIFIDDDLIYNEIINILDTVKYEQSSGSSQVNLLYPKIIFGSVIL
jgi:biopolymer transport protein ExbD